MAQDDSTYRGRNGIGKGVEDIKSEGTEARNRKGEILIEKPRHFSSGGEVEDKNKKSTPGAVPQDKSNGTGESNGIKLEAGELTMCKCSRPKTTTLVRARRSPRLRRRGPLRQQKKENSGTINSPLDQFAIHPLIDMKIGDLYFSFTNPSLFMLLSLTLFLLLVHLVTKKGGGDLVPNAWQSLVELLYDFVLNLVNEQIGGLSGNVKQKFFPIILYLFGMPRLGLPSATEIGLGTETATRGKIGKRKTAFLSIRRKKEGAARPGKRTKYALVSEKQPGIGEGAAQSPELGLGSSDPINREWMPGKPGERMGWSSYRYYRIGLYILYYSHATSGPFQARECRDWQVQIVHVLREGNRCADFLARMGSSQLEQFMPWESPSRLLVSPSRASVAKRLAAAPAKLRQQPLPSSIPSLTAPSLCAPFSSKPEGNDKIKNRSAPSLCAMQEVPWLIEVNQSAMFSLIALPIDRLQKASPGEQQDELCLTVDESLHSDAFKSLQLCDPASLGIPGVKPMTGKELPTLTGIEPVSSTKGQPPIPTISDQHASWRHGISPLSISDKQAPARTFLLTSCRYGFIPVGIAPLGIDEVIPRSGKEARLADLEFLNPISLVLYYYYNGALARLHPKLKPASPPSIPFSESAPLEIWLVRRPCLAKAN
ncbi:unnamed protein product [Lupinus luteus]|uniref:F-ATPase protein 6 n=1 Tax=Lupinus luteus TaxID=3873 RepID=A0AAV1WZX7_LUPLU